MWCLSMQKVDFDLVSHRLAIYLRTRMDLAASMTSDSALSHQCDNTFTPIRNWQGSTTSSSNSESRLPALQAINDSRERIAEVRCYESSK